MTENKPFKMNLQFFSDPQADPVEPKAEPTEPTEPTVTDPVPEESKDKEVTEPSGTTGADEVVALQAQVGELTEQISTLNSENEQLKAQVLELSSEKDGAVKTVSEKDTKIESYQKVLEGIAEEKAKAVPDNIKALMPADLPVDEKLNWLDKALGVEPPKSEDKPVVVEIGKPTPVPSDNLGTEKLSARQKMSNAFGNIF